MISLVMDNVKKTNFEWYRVSYELGSNMVISIFQLIGYTIFGYQYFINFHVLRVWNTTSTPTVLIYDQLNLVSLSEYFNELHQRVAVTHKIVVHPQWIVFIDILQISKNLFLVSKSSISLSSSNERSIGALASFSLDRILALWRDISKTQKYFYQQCNISYAISGSTWEPAGDSSSIYSRPSSESLKLLLFHIIYLFHKIYGQERKWWTGKQFYDQIGKNEQKRAM